MIPKFRVFIKETITETDEMKNVILINFKSKLVRTNDEKWYGFEDAVLMQSTGLHDKNGVEIFEYSELDGDYEVIFKDLRYSLRHIQNNDIIDLYDYWRGKNGEIEVTRKYTKV